MTAEFTEEMAVKVLNAVRRGATLVELSEQPDYPDLLDMYDWLKDPKAAIGDRTFRLAYTNACQDRAQTWLDISAKAIDLVPKDADGTVFKLAEQRGRLLSTAAKEQRMQMAEVRKTAGDDTNVTVVIQRFAPDPEEPIGDISPEPLIAAAPLELDVGGPVSPPVEPPKKRRGRPPGSKTRSLSARKAAGPRRPRKTKDKPDA